MDEPRKKAAQKAVGTKRANLIAWIDGLEITIPIMDMETLYKRACAHYNGHKFHDDYNVPASLESSPGFLERIAVNYLRHGCTHYDRQLEQLAGKVGRKAGYQHLRFRVCKAIAAAYPELEREADYQIYRDV